MDIHLPLSPNALGFTNPVIDKINAYMINKTIFADDKFYKEYLNIIKNLSINDAKQIIYIYRIQNSQPANFDYYSEENVLIDLTTIVSSLQNPTSQLQDLFKAKYTYLLPTKIHEWIENDLAAMLFFVQCIPNSLTNKSFIGKEEFKRFFTNFIQFNIIYYNCGNISYSPIQFQNGADIPYWIAEYEDYKRWYLDTITPSKSFKWLEKCDEEQLDNILENLANKSLKILDKVFYPQSSEDKIALIIASINSIPIEGKYEWFKPYEDISMEFTINSTVIYKVEPYIDLWLLVDNPIPFDKDKYQGIGIPKEGTNRDSSTLEFSQGKHKGYYIGKQKKKYQIYERDYYLKQLKETNRKKQHRTYTNIARDERTVTILKKNMPLLQRFAKIENITIDKFVNNFIEVMYKEGIYDK